MKIDSHLEAGRLSALHWFRDFVGLDFFAVLKNQPILVSITAILAGFLMVLNHLKIDPLDPFLFRYLFVLLFLFTSVFVLSVVAHMSAMSLQKYKIIQLFCFLLSGVVFWSLPSLPNEGLIFQQTKMWFLILSTLSLFLIPYFDKKVTDQKEAEFFKLSVSAILLAGFASIVVILTSVLGIYAIDKLIVSIPRIGNYIVSAAIVAGSLIFVLLFHGLLIGSQEILSNVQKFVNTISKLVFLPALFIYESILLIYIAIYLTRFDLPRGTVSAMVMVCFGITIFIEATLNKGQAKRLRKASRWFLVPLIGMFWVAIGQRISQYGFTPIRYVQGLVCFSLTLYLIYLIFDLKKSLSLLICGLGVISLCVANGPLDVWHVSQLSQWARFEKFLVSKGLLVDGVWAKRDPSSVSPQDRIVVTSFLDWWNRYGNRNQLKAILSKEAQLIWEPAIKCPIGDCSSERSWAIPMFLGKYLGYESLNSLRVNEKNEVFVGAYLKPNTLFSIGSNQYMGRVTCLNLTSLEPFAGGADDLYLSFQSNCSRVDIYKDAKVVCTISDFDKTVFREGLLQKEMILRLKGDHCYANFVIENVSFVKTLGNSRDNKTTAVGGAKIKEVSLRGSTIVTFTD